MANEILISQVWAREILDARGTPTLEVTIYLNNQAMVVTSISTNHDDSTGLKDSRDSESSHMGGMGVQNAISIINNQIGPRLVNLNPVNQPEIDNIILSTDASNNSAKVGANTMMVLSMSVLKAAAVSYGWPSYYYIWKRFQLVQNLQMPTCLFGMFNGGSLGEDNMDFAETQIIAAKNISFSRALEMAVITFNNLRGILMSKGGGQATSSIGGFIPVLPRNTDAFDLLVEAIRVSGFVMGRDLFFGVDFDAEHYYQLGRYKIKDITNPMNAQAMVDYLKKMHTNYGVYMYEDPFDPSDLGTWKKFYNEMDGSVRLLTDRMTNTNLASINKAIEQKVCNTYLVKPGQVRTVTELYEIIKTIRLSGNQFVIAHRQGETTDDLIADMAVGFGADFCKFGPPNRGERIAKYNRLLRIEEEVNQINAVTAANTASATAAAPSPAAGII